MTRHVTMQIVGEGRKLIPHVSKDAKIITIFTYLLVTFWQKYFTETT